MTTRVSNISGHGSRGFTLIELIGVLAIIAIMASVIAPNALRSLDRAAVRAEAETAAQLGEQIKLHLRDQGVLPTTANWTTAIANYSDLAAIDIQRNKRLNNRLLVFDTSTTPYPRALILSSMRTGRNLPNVGSATANFQTIWQTEDSQIPFTLGWAGWLRTFDGGGNIRATDGDYLVVERINFRPLYLGELQDLTVALKNDGASQVSYRITRANGTVAAAVNVAVGATVSLTGLRPNDRVDLYRAAGGSTLDYTCVLSATGKNFDFDGIRWVQK